MTTQALTLVTPVSTSAPLSSTTLPSNEADSFASVLASQSGAVESSDTPAEPVLAPPPSDTTARSALDSLLEPTEADEEPENDALSMIAATLFIASEAASIQQGLRAQPATPAHPAAQPQATPRQAGVLHSTERALPTTTRQLANEPTDKSLTSPKGQPLPPVTTTSVATNTEVVDTPSLSASKAPVSVTTLAANSAAASKNTPVVEGTKTPLATALPPHATPSLSTAELAPPAASDAPVAAFTAVSATSSPITIAATASSPVAHASLNQPLDSPAWGQDFSKTMLSFTRQGVQHAELRLDPPELGPLRISLKLSDNIAHAYIVSAHANVRQAVEQALPQLQQALAQNGLSLGQADVSDHAADQAFYFQQEGGETPSDSANATHFEDILHGRRSASEPTPSPMRRPAPDALIDTFA